MARAAKNVKNLQVFRGSLSRPDVFAHNSGNGCCVLPADPTYDKLGDRTRFDNSLAHSNPLGANDKFEFPGGNGFSGVSQEIVAWVNANGVGSTISVLVLPTFCRWKGVCVQIDAEEAGMTFDLITRNGAIIPNAVVDVIQVDLVDGCTNTRTRTAGNLASFAGFGALTTHLRTDIFGYDGNGTLCLEAEEIILRVATMPTVGVFAGTAKIKVAASYEVVKRAG